jgi:GAF domain-containing protein
VADKDQEPAERHVQRPEQGERRGQPSSHAAEGASRDDVTQRLADLARQMQGQADAPAVMTVIVSSAVGAIPGVEGASVSLVHARRRVVSAVATGDLARRFDHLQQETRQGPCLDAMYEQQTVRVDDLTTEPRWPELARRVGELGVGSALCFQLFVRDDDLGALNLLARRPRAFTDESERIGLLYAAHAAIALADAQDLDRITTALTSRDLIGQAKGILMERYKVTAEMAFALLAKTSQETNRKLHDVAERLASTGGLGG